MNIRFAEKNEFPEVLSHYKVCNYGGGVEDTDMIVIAADEQIIGAVRICIEHGTKVLRGMQVKPAYQGKGVGASMLKYLVDQVDMNGCYCLPYKHLKTFYASIGFEEISLKDAPVLLAERLEKYLSSGNHEIIIMVINYSS